MPRNTWILYHDFYYTRITPQSLTFSYTANGKWFENGWHKNVYQSSRKITRRGHTVININKFNRKLNTTRYFDGNQCPTSVSPSFHVHIRETRTIYVELPEAHFLNSLSTTLCSLYTKWNDNREIHYELVLSLIIKLCKMLSSVCHWSRLVWDTY